MMAALRRCGKETVISRISECKKWIESHPFVPLDLVRVYLGAGLIAKGFFFLQHPDVLGAIERTSALPQLPFPIATLVIGAHLVGGALLAAGLFTRLAALVQIPIFYGAINYVYIGQMRTLQDRQGFEFTGLILFLLMLLVIFGSGPWSLDHRLFKKSGDAASAQAQPDLFLDVVRAFLGVALFLKGIFFMEHRDLLLNLVERSGSWSIIPLAAIHYVIPAHIGGGLLLLVGLMTRLAALAQLPLLLGAVFYFYLPNLLAVEGRQDFEFAALVLFLVSVVAVFGAGRWSVDHALAKGQPAQFEATPAS